MATYIDNAADHKMLQNNIANTFYDTYELVLITTNNRNIIRTVSAYNLEDAIVWAETMYLGYKYSEELTKKLALKRLLTK